MIVLNFKSYKEVGGKKALKAIKTIERVSKKYGVEIAVSPQLLDLPILVNRCNIELFSQHVDPIIEGKGTGRISFSSLISYGIKASLLNHSERKISFLEIVKTVKIARKLNFKILLLADSLKEAKKIAKLKPWAIGLEPPELIGTGRSVSKEKPATLKKFVKIVKKISPGSLVFCGAGISSGEDVEKALEFGIDGVLVASAFSKARNKRKKLIELAKPFFE